MLVSKLYPRRYATGEDLAGKTPTLPVRKVTMEKVGPVQKPVIYFHGAQKGIVLTATLARDIRDILGDDTDGWTDQPVTLSTRRVVIDSRVCWSIRASSAAPATPPPAPTRAGHYDPDLDAIVYQEQATP